MLFLIVNKYSGNYSKKRIVDLESEVKKIFSDYDFIGTVKINDKIGIGLDPVKIQKDDILCAVGGDGTVNTCLQYIHDHSLQDKVLLGIIPVGTGNNMIGSLKLKKDFSKAVQIIKKAELEKISYGTINNDRVFFNCSFGFTSHVLTKRKTNSLTGYIYDTLRLFPSFKGCCLRIEGESLERNLFAGFFINTKVYMSKFRFLKSNNCKKDLNLFYMEKGIMIDIPPKALLSFLNPEFYKRLQNEKFVIHPGMNCVFELDGDIYSTKDEKRSVIIENHSAVNVITNNEIK